jgi:catechol 2,3-dioxygenase-like lactoylglutathione lyase family enzyme
MFGDPRFDLAARRPLGECHLTPKRRQERGWCGQKFRKVRPGRDIGPWPTSTVIAHSRGLRDIRFPHKAESNRRKHMSAIEGLSHMTFIVRDLDRMERLLTTVLGARKVYDSGTETFSLSKERFFTIGSLWIATMEGDPLPTRTYNHLAFKINDADYDGFLDRIRALDLELTEGRSRVEGEGRSIYFYDHDNHMFELHTGTLEQRLMRYSRGR